MEFELVHIIASIVGVVYLYTLLSTIFVLILENRNPTRSISWVIILLFLPVLGLFFYLIFGQNLRQRKKITKLSIRRKEPFQTKLKTLHPESYAGLDEKTTGLIHLLYNATHAVVYENSKLDIFTVPEKTFEQIFKDIEAAQNNIHIEFYIIGNDEVGIRMRDLIIKKAQAGVEVRLIYDFWGSFELNKKYLKPMRDAGVEFEAFYPPRFPYILGRLNFRNHRKIIIIDGKIGYTGGVNMANRYLYGDKLGFWRDSMIRIEGSAVYGLQETFLSDWCFTRRVMLSGKQYFPKQESFGENKIQIVDSGPDTRFKAIMYGIHHAISTAQKYVYIQTPYFMPTDEVFAAIQSAALRGVDVRLNIPTKSDTSMAQAGNNSYLERLLETGVKVYFYNKGFLHSKTIVADDFISTIGTANMDFRSFEQNFEVNAFIYDTKTAKKLKAIYLQDLGNSKELLLRDWQKRPILERFRESISRLFSPVM